MYENYGMISLLMTLTREGNNQFQNTFFDLIQDIETTREVFLKPFRLAVHLPLF